MTVARIIKVETKGVPTHCAEPSDVYEHTFVVRQWENVLDRPEEPEISARFLDPEVRAQLIDWLREAD